ncbi:hypothetical protein TWF506_007099, partial [Arthrobotrys conoides]
MVAPSYLISLLAVLVSVSSSPIIDKEVSLFKRQQAPNAWRPYPVKRNTAYLLPQPLETHQQHVLEITTYYQASGRKNQFSEIALSPLDVDVATDRNLNIRIFGVEGAIDGQLQFSTQKNGVFKNKRKVTDAQAFQIYPGVTFGSATAVTRWRRVVIIIRYKVDTTAPKGGYYLVRFLGDDATKCKETRYDFPPASAAQHSRWISYISSHNEILSEEL